MGVFDRLANLARGKVLVWRRGEPVAPREVEEELRRPTPRSEESSESTPAAEDNVRRPVPATPRKRRL